MGFADSAIAIIKGNRHLQKQNQYLKRHVLPKASDELGESVKCSVKQLSSGYNIPNGLIR